MRINMVHTHEKSCFLLCFSAYPAIDAVIRQDAPSALYGMQISTPSSETCDIHGIGDANPLAYEPINMAAIEEFDGTDA